MRPVRIHPATYVLICPYCKDHIEPSTLEHLPPFGSLVECETCGRKLPLPKRYQSLA